MGSRRKRRGVPIPSFGTRHIPVSPVAEAAMRTAPWNASTLKQVFFALLRSSHGSSKYIKFTDFYREVQLVPVIDDTAHAAQHCLEHGEQLLVDLLCATSPTLYKCSKGILEVVNFSGNRLTELQKQCNETQMAISKYDECLRHVLSHRRRMAEQKVLSKEPPQKPKEKEASIVPQFQPNMSLEERVRARAAAGEERQRVANDYTNKSVDQASMLRLADALWSHSRHILLRQSQIQATSPIRHGSTSANTACVMTLKDIVYSFAGSFAPSQQSTTNVTKIEKATKRQIIDAVGELQRLAPDWISCSDKDLTKSTTVWMKPIDYQVVRAKLGAPLPDSLQTPVPSKRSFVADKAIVTLTHSDMKSTTHTLETIPAKRQRITEATPPVAMTVPPIIQSPRPFLRINPNLILSPADYNGGMVIQASGENPRGLKRMFTQMNAGMRI